MGEKIVKLENIHKKFQTSLQTKKIFAADAIKKLIQFFFFSKKIDKKGKTVKMDKKNRKIWKYL